MYFLSLSLGGAASTMNRYYNSTNNSVRYFGNSLRKYTYRSSPSFLLPRCQKKRIYSQHRRGKSSFILSPPPVANVLSWNSSSISSYSSSYNLSVSVVPPRMNMHKMHMNRNNMDATFYLSNPSRNISFSLNLKRNYSSYGYDTVVADVAACSSSGGLWKPCNITKPVKPMTATALHPFSLYHQRTLTYIHGYRHRQAGPSRYIHAFSAPLSFSSSASDTTWSRFNFNTNKTLYITTRCKHLQNGYGSKAGNRHKGRKTRSCAKKRFNTLPDGTVIRKMTGHRHKTGWKSSQQMKRLRVTRNLSGNWAKKVKFLLGDYK